MLALTAKEKAYANITVKSIFVRNAKVLEFVYITREKIDARNVRSLLLNIANEESKLE